MLQHKVLIIANKSLLLSQQAISNLQQLSKQQQLMLIK